MVLINLYEDSASPVWVTSARRFTILGNSEMVIDGANDTWRTGTGMIEMDQEPTEARPWLLARALVEEEMGMVRFGSSTY